MSGSVRLRHGFGLAVAAGLVLLQAGCGSADSSAPTANAPVESAPVVENTAAPSSSTPGALDSPALLPDVSTLPPVGAPDAPAPALGSTLSEGDISITIVDAPAYAATIERQKGKVVLVDFWATWCGPCKEGFPHSVELSRKFKDSGLAVVSVSFDDPEHHKNALHFLAEQQASFENLVSQHGMSVESGVAFDIVGGALPFYKLYDRSGQLRYQFTANVEGLDGVLKTEELDNRVQELIAEGA